MFRLQTLLLLSSLASSWVASFSPTRGIRRVAGSVVVQVPTKRTAWQPLSLAPQLLEFKEPRTNVTVILVGAMHYNPTSVALAADTVRGLGQRNALGSVIVEQCDIRWNKTIELLQQRPYLEPIYTKVLSNEMRAACDAALEFRRPVILGDQRVNITFSSIKDAVKQTAADLATPSGWNRMYNDIRQSFEEAVPLGDGYLNAVSLLDTRLLLAAPVSFVKYPLSFLVRNPVSTAIAFSILFGLNFLDQASMESLAAGEASAADLAVSLAMSALETIFFARIFLKPMLAERNVILAQNILEQCKFYQDKNWWEVFPSSKQISDLEIVYAPESNAAGISPSSDGSAKTVVAVLGMAHCNGIKKLLIEQRL